MSETEAMFILGECATLNTDMGGKFLNPMRSLLSSSQCQQGIRRRDRGGRRRGYKCCHDSIYSTENKMHVEQTKMCIGLNE